MGIDDHINGHCQGASIHLIGRNRFQNNLFVANLKKIHNCKSTFVVANNLDELPSELGKDIERQTLVLLDCFELPFEELETLLRSCRSKYTPNVLLALYNLNQESGYEKKALNYRIRGFFYQNDKTKDFCQGIRRILANEIWLSRALMSEVVSSTAKTEIEEQPEYLCKSCNLSNREMQVLSILSRGVSNSVIANDLCISIHTVRTHLYKIFKKINVNSRAQAILWSQTNLQPPSRGTKTP